MNILITGAWQQANNYISTLQNMGHLVQFLQFEKNDLPCSYNWVEAIIGNGIFLSHSIENFLNLKYIQLTSAGFDRVPLDYINQHGIVLNNARGVYSVPMAEYAVAGVLSLYKQLNAFVAQQKSHTWKKIRNLKELYNQNICIVGCGSVGIECAKRFRAFGCNIMGVDLLNVNNQIFSHVYHLNDISEALSQADVVVITLPLSNQTYHMFNEVMFNKMKNDSIIVNIARGALVDTNALITALENKLSGAVLDVFEEEPLTDSPLWNMKDVVITPHNSFVGDGNNQRLSDLIMKNLEKYRYENTCSFT